MQGGLFENDSCFTSSNILNMIFPQGERVCLCVKGYPHECPILSSGKRWTWIYIALQKNRPALQHSDIESLLQGPQEYRTSPFSFSCSGYPALHKHNESFLGVGFSLGLMLNCVWMGGQKFCLVKTPFHCQMVYLTVRFWRKNVNFR